LSAYSQSKWKGEEAVRRLLPEAIIARVGVLYGWGRKDKDNFVTWLIKQLRKGNEVKIVTDQFCSPTYAGNAAEVMAALLRKNAAGTFHCAGGERISRFEFAKKIAFVFGLKEGLIKPSLSAELKQKAPRPRDSSLAVGKAERETGIKMLTAEQGLRKMKEEKEG